jgi:hypothetical protein
VVIVNPAGTGNDIFTISARLAPLPPSNDFISAFPSAFFPPKKYTYLPGIYISSEIRLIGIVAK